MFRSLSIVVLLLILPFLAFAQRDGQQGSPIIDMHMHAHPANRFGKVGLPNPITGKPSAATSDEALLQAALEAMRRHHIVKAFASSYLDSVERWRAAAPERIVGGAQIDVGIPIPEVERLRRDFIAGRLGLLGEVGAQYLGLPPSDPVLEPYFALAEELDIPVGIHTGISSPNTPYECCPKFRAALGRPLLLEDVLIRHPKMRVYLMHAGYPYLQEMVALMSVYPQVYADLSAIDWIIPRADFHAYLQGLMRAGLGKRLMFGSDQMIWPEAIGMAIEGIESARFLTPEQKRDIFYNNAARFLRLSERHDRDLDSADTNKIYLKYESTHPAVIINLPAPELTPEAIANPAPGEMIIEVVLERFGEVTNIVLRGNLKNGMTARAIAAARKIKFKPALLDGKPVSQRSYIKYSVQKCPGGKLCTRAVEVLDL